MSKIRSFDIDRSTFLCWQGILFLCFSGFQLRRIKGLDTLAQLLLVLLLSNVCLRKKD